MFVAGHTDARGERDYNLDLSIRRADAVADAVLRQGVNVAKVWRVGFGEDMPLKAGEYEEAWGQNRRVEFLFAPRAEAVAAWLADAQVDLRCQGEDATAVRACRLQQPMRTSYVAQEVSSVRREALPSGGAQQTLNPSGSLGDAGPSHRTVSINPVGTQRIIINPVNRRSGPVEAN
jgi:hypothetical protein